jgi:tryptophan synthase alpha chain
VSTLPANAGAQRIADAFSASGKRAALMPYLMGGFPDLDVSRAIGEAYADGGADLVELGVPFSDPLADGPVIQAAGTRALAAGATVASVIELAAALSERMPVVLMCYTNLVLARGVAACDAAGLALVPLVAPTTPEERLAAIGARARGFLYTVSVTGTTGERAALSDAFAGVVARAKAHTSVPVALGFGIATPEHAAQAADAGADGVIVGSRLVRAAGEAADPAGAVREVVAEMADALRG